MPEIAEEIYETTRSKYLERLDQYEVIRNFLNDEIAQKGYATKKDIYDTVSFTGSKKRNQAIINKCLSQFGENFKRDFKYSQPTKEEKEKYNLEFSFWIIREREK